MRIEDATKNPHALTKSPKSKTWLLVITTVFASCAFLLSIVFSNSDIARKRYFGVVAGSTESSFEGPTTLVEIAVDIKGEEMPTQWPNLVGMPGQQAKDTIERENTELTLVVIIPDGSPVTADYREDRVRIFVDNDGKVTQIPRVG